MIRSIRQSRPNRICGERRSPLRANRSSRGNVVLSPTRMRVQRTSIGGYRANVMTSAKRRHDELEARLFDAMEALTAAQSEHARAQGNLLAADRVLAGAEARVEAARRALER